MIVYQSELYQRAVHPQTLGSSQTLDQYSGPIYCLSTFLACTNLCTMGCDLFIFLKAGATLPIVQIVTTGTIKAR